MSSCLVILQNADGYNLLTSLGLRVQYCSLRVTSRGGGYADSESEFCPVYNGHCGHATRPTSKTPSPCSSWSGQGDGRIELIAVVAGVD